MVHHQQPAMPGRMNSGYDGEFNEGLTAREYAAIKLRVPDSGTDWLDAMIEKSLLNEFAGQAMQGWLSAWGQHDVTDFEEIASDSKNLAVAMLKASKGE